MRATRRGILLGAGAAGGLLVAWGLTPRRFAPVLTARVDETLFGAWLRIGRDGVVTVAVPQLEMGQGVTTLLAQIVAGELGADWRQVAAEPVPPSGAFANVPLAARWSALWMPALPSLAGDPAGMLAQRWAQANDFTVTADGSAIAAYETGARAAAAAARAMLAMAAADRWGVGWEECEADRGFITHGEKKLSFAALAADAADYTPPDPPVLRPAPLSERAGEFPAGAAPRYPRLDLPAKVDGSYRFAADVRLPGMVFAAIRHAPIGGAALGAHDARPAKAVPGFIGTVEGPDWLAAAAQDWWSAERALELIAPKFTVRNRANSAQIAKALATALRSGPATTLAEAGDPAAAAAAPFSHAARYSVAPALHATLETASAAARLTDGRLELWIAAQAPAAARRAAADALGLAERNVVLYPMPAGGSFDRRLEHTHAAQAALIARALGKPVSLTWSRWQEHVAGPPRPPVVAALAAHCLPDGTVTGWKTRIAVPASGMEFGARLLGGKTPHEALSAQDQFDPLAVEGAVPPYGLTDLVVEHVPVALPLPTGRMRGNAHGYTCFFTESFIDELAHRANREPLSYRMALLGHDLRLAQCLQRAATLASWNGGAAGSGQGLACHAIGTAETGIGRIALIASASRETAGIRVDRLTAVADIGRIVNVDIARQQIEGGLVFGLGLAVGSAATYADGLPVSGRLGTLNLPRLADCPVIEVDFIDSDDVPADPGELGVAVAAPAIANALFSVTGLRLRSLPLMSEVP